MLSDKWLSRYELLETFNPEIPHFEHVLDILSRHSDILSHSDDIISRSDDIITRFDDLISRSDDIITYNTTF